jgi:hypothetical protein
MIDEMMTNDQKYRTHPVLLNPYILILDSLKGVYNIHTNEDLMAMDQEKKEEMFAKTKAITQERYNPDPQVVDSLWKLQGIIDSTNTLKLIEIIEKVDYPKLFDYECIKSSYVIFVHSPKQYHNKIRSLISEREEYIFEGTVRHINWHLDGRPRRN